MADLATRQKSAAWVLLLCYTGWVFLSFPGTFWFAPEGWFGEIYPLFIFWSGILAMIGPLVMWLVWGPMRLMPRLARAGLVLLVLYLAWWGGVGLHALTHGGSNGVGDPWEFLRAHAIVCLTVPSVVFAAAVPPLALRFLFGFHAVRANSTPESTGMKFSLAGIMLLTAAVAANLGCLRLAYNVGPSADTTEFMLIIALCMAWAFGVSLLSVPAAVLWILWPHKSATCVAGITGYLLGAVMIIVFTGLLNGVDGDTILFFLTLLAAFSTSLLAPVIYARACGYRLKRWRRETVSEREDAPTA